MKDNCRVVSFTKMFFKMIYSFSKVSFRNVTTRSDTQKTLMYISNVVRVDKHCVKVIFNYDISYFKDFLCIPYGKSKKRDYSAQNLNERFITFFSFPSKNVSEKIANQQRKIRKSSRCGQAPPVKYSYILVYIPLIKVTFNWAFMCHTFLSTVWPCCRTG